MFYGSCQSTGEMRPALMFSTIKLEIRPDAQNWKKYWICSNPGRPADPFSRLVFI